MMMKTLSFKKQSFTIHLAISVIVALVNLALVFMVWHPSPLAKAVGVTSIFTMMVIIDTVLGPLLTFVVANEKKKRYLMLLDFVIIAVLQFSALLYGVYSISQNRVSYIAFDTHRFELVQAGDIPKETREQALPEYQQANYWMPKYVAVKPAKDDKDMSDRLFIEMGSGVAPSMQADLYEPLNHQWTNVVTKSKAFSELEKYNTRKAVAKQLQKYPEATGWLPLKAYEESMVVLINQDKVIKIVDLRPW